jgi:preprotein translocase subunit YajC
MFISSAYAQAASGMLGGGAGGIVQMLPFALIFVVFYFLLIRPQQKKVKEHKAMVSAVKRGDRVITSGGLIGVVTKVVDDNELQLEIAEGVRVRVLKGSVNDVLTRSDVARSQDKASQDKAQDNKPQDKGSAGDKKGGSR